MVAFVVGWIDEANPPRWALRLGSGATYEVRGACLTLNSPTS
jgi:hypothetical protein